MIRKLLVVAAAIAMPVSLVAVSGGMAGASNPQSAATDSVACTKHHRYLDLFTEDRRQGIHVGQDQHQGRRRTLTGCTAHGSQSQPSPITKGTVSGTLVGADRQRQTKPRRHSAPVSTSGNGMSRREF